MTCEVVVLNRLGLSLAADSAVTFNSQGPNSNGSTTYSSGANKIFQLTEKQPVGLMVFNSATLQGVPWELIIKSFRSQFGAGACSRLADYKMALAEYIEQQQELFPSVYRDDQFRRLLAQAGLLFVAQVRKCPDLLDLTQVISHPGRWAELVQSLVAVTNETPLAHFFTPLDVSDKQAQYGEWLGLEIDTYVASQPDLQHLSPFFSEPGIANLVIEGAFKLYKRIFGHNYTGVVFAGYGKEDYFPAFFGTTYYGFVGDKLVWHDEANGTVDHNKASVIEAFAQKSMVETFLVGAAPSIWSSARHCFRSFAEQACQDALEKAGAILAVPDLESILDKALVDFGQKWSETAIETHYSPLLQVVSSLTVEEMGELAETLVMLESLKEKVTSRTQSVGGPVDVVVITKAEGLVWIKRKLYFSPELNHRYFARLNS
jgi:hypothetical protein